MIGTAFPRIFNDPSRKEALQKLPAKRRKSDEKQGNDSVMKKARLITGILLLLAAVLALAFAGLNLFGYYHVLDGSQELYAALQRRALVFFIGGGLLAVLGAVCLLRRKKTQVRAPGDKRQKKDSGKG